ncbi:MAG: amidohydrolase family protein, partial [Sphingobacteriaceae bacterium]
MKKILLLCLSAIVSLCCDAQKLTVLKPDRVFDGQNVHENWWVLVSGNHIEAVGDAKEFKVPASAEIIDLKGMTLLPGLIEGHSHLFLHPYNETPWNDQVLT